MLTVIIFAVEPERQQELVDTIIEFVETAVRRQPGFIIHKSLDGVRDELCPVEKPDHEAFINNPSVQSFCQSLRVSFARLPRL